MCTRFRFIVIPYSFLHLHCRSTTWSYPSSHLPYWSLRSKQSLVKLHSRRAFRIMTILSGKWMTKFYGPPTCEANFRFIHCHTVFPLSDMIAFSLFFFSSSVSFLILIQTGIYIYRILSSPAYYYIIESVRFSLCYARFKGKKDI